MDNRLIYYWLSKNLSARTANKLLAAYAPDEIWNKTETVIDLFSIRGAGKETLITSKNERELSAEIERLEADGIELVLICDDNYPSQLKRKEVVPPIALYCKGDVSLLSTRSIAIVGTRTCSEYGKYATKYFGGELAAAGLTVVSGLALGIDALAHESALDAKGKTVAVLGSGLNHMSPVSNYNLFKRICKEGLVVSEYPPNAEATKFTFPERNRIVSGLSCGVLVVEAGERSGSSITASLAIDQGRDVYAVPGPINSPKSAGTNNLISSGAYIAISPSQMLGILKSKYEDIGAVALKNEDKKSKVNANSVIMLDFNEQIVYNCLEKARLSVDELVETANLKPHEVSTVLMNLEMKSLVEREGGKYFLRRQ